VAGNPRETKHVLVLYSLRTILPVQEEIDQGLRAVLQKDYCHPVEIDLEFLDLDRFAEPPYVDELISLLRRKYTPPARCHHPRISSCRKIFTSVWGPNLSRRAGGFDCRIQAIFAGLHLEA
jgi:hypothetical protein